MNSSSMYLTLKSLNGQKPFMFSTFAGTGCKKLALSSTRINYSDAGKVIYKHSVCVGEFLGTKPGCQGLLSQRAIVVF